MLDKKIIRPPAFTFHYASTLSQSLSDEDRRLLNLHSTMLLLYPAVIWASAGKVSEFTFHYASTLSSESDSSLSASMPIYIPLCFYFIQDEPSRRATSDRFTFHYASTLSSSKGWESVCPANLHSTMLLLYPQ